MTRKLITCGALTLLALLALTLCARCHPSVAGRALLGPLSSLIWPDISTAAKPADGLHPRVTRVTATASGHWTPTITVTPADTLPVTVTITADGQDTTAVIVIGTDTVRVDSVRVIASVERLRWGLYIEGSAPLSGTVGPTVAVGAAWKPVSVWGVEAGPYASADTRLRWGAGGLRISRRIHSTAEAGLELGYRIGDQPGACVGLSIGFAL